MGDGSWAGQAAHTDPVLFESQATAGVTVFCRLLRRFVCRANRLADQES